MRVTRPWLAAASLPMLAAAPSYSGWRLPATVQSLLELLPSFDLAVPKKKVSHSRKAMRSANKGLKDKRSACFPPRTLPRPADPPCQILCTVQDADHQNLHIICAQIAIRASAAGGRQWQRRCRIRWAPVHHQHRHDCTRNHLWTLMETDSLTTLQLNIAVHKYLEQLFSGDDQHRARFT